MQITVKSTLNSGIEIYVAAKQGEPDPHSNQKLKFVIDRAKLIMYHVISSNVRLKKQKVAAMATTKNSVTKVSDQTAL